MMNMQLSGEITRNDGWYCTKCGYGPHNPQIDAGCAICGHIPQYKKQAQAFDEQTPTDLGDQFLPTTYPTSPMRYTDTPTVALELQLPQNPGSSWIYTAPELSNPEHFSGTPSGSFPVNGHQLFCDAPKTRPIPEINFPCLH